MAGPVLIGFLQGVLEWLPVSSEGSVAVALRAVAGTDPTAAVGYALFLHAGTALAAAYYRREVGALAAAVRDWRPRLAFDGENAELTSLGAATVASAAAAAGYLAVGALVVVAERLPFWTLCVGFGLLAAVGGVAAAV